MRRSHTEPLSTSSVIINVVPLVDVMCFLLIFYIVTTSFVQEAGVDVNRPTAQTAVQKEGENILIAVTRDGEIWMDKRRIDIRSVRINVERALAQTPEAPVVVVTDRESRTGTLVEIIDQARLAGAAGVAIAASQPEGMTQ
jgi:biopolymer transport protein ExbD